MHYQIFTLQPKIFSGFLENSLIARAISKNIISVDLINWREEFGIGGYKQIDDKPFGGGSGMVLMADPIKKSLIKHEAASEVFAKKLDQVGFKSVGEKALTLGAEKKTDKLPNLLQKDETVNVKVNEYKNKSPNNPIFFDYWRLTTENKWSDDLPNKEQSKVKDFLENSSQRQRAKRDLETWNKTNLSQQIDLTSITIPKKINIYLTPRGYRWNQKMAYWITNFEKINIICGRYEGLDYRILDEIDLEISIGDFILNGGEIASMVLIESISRLLPEFVTKAASVDHDSFSKNLNLYQEIVEYSKIKTDKNNLENTCFFDQNMIKQRKIESLWEKNIFDEHEYLAKFKQIEHPQFTRPETWQGISVPKPLISGNHKEVQNWRNNWFD